MLVLKIVCEDYVGNERSFARRKRIGRPRLSGAIVLVVILDLIQRNGCIPHLNAAPIAPPIATAPAAIDCQCSKSSAGTFHAFGSSHSIAMFPRRFPGKFFGKQAGRKSL
jgi:hypothetical protein